MEAAVIAAAVAAKRTGRPLEGDEAPPAAGTRSRKGDLPAETAWLLLVAEAYAHHPAPDNAKAAARPGRVGASPNHPTPKNAEAASPNHPAPKNTGAAS